jgi:signal transduction histidine kinase
VTRSEDLPAHHDFPSTVFHDLSQPLTALHCSLELALLRDQTIEEFRSSVEAALENAERLRQRLLLLRELSDADDPGDTSVPLDLDRLLQRTRADMLPLFESAGRSFEMTCEAMRVPANEAKLTRGFFYLLEFLLRCESPGCGLCLRGRRSRRRQLEIRIEGCGAHPDGSSKDCLDLDGSGGLEIARRTFRAIGGDLTWMVSVGLPGVWIVQLPCLS